MFVENIKLIKSPHQGSAWYFEYFITAQKPTPKILKSKKQSKSDNDNSLDKWTKILSKIVS